MWRILDWPRIILPVPVFLKRLAAPLWVLSLGLLSLLEITDVEHQPVYGQLSGWARSGSARTTGRPSRMGLIQSKFVDGFSSTRTLRRAWHGCLRRAESELPPGLRQSRPRRYGREH